MAQTYEERLAKLKADREERMAKNLAERAAADPMFNPAVRPEAPQTEPGFIQYYAWIGGGTTGSWRLYKAAENGPFAASAEARSVGGKTQQTGITSIGANALASDQGTSNQGTGNKNTGKTEVSRVTNNDGTITITYSDGSTSTLPAASGNKSNYKGSGSAGDPLTLDGVPFNGTYNNKQYANGVIVATGSGNGNNGAGGNGGGANYTGNGTTNDPLKLNGANFTGAIGGVNYVNGVKEDTAKRTAQQEFRASLAEFGLADLAVAIDDLIRQDYTVSQIKLELPKQQAYKDRFPGMQALRDAGQAINEATYISMEKGYLQTLQAYGLDTKALGSRKQLGTYVSNLVSPREFEERVNLAATRVKNNDLVIQQFKAYYPEVDNSALTAYLLNPTVGMDIIKKQVRLAEIGAAAMDVGFGTGVSLTTAEDLQGAVGEKDYQTVKEAFGQAKLLSDQQARLARIEGTGYSQNEAIQGIVGKDIPSQLASQRRAERETMTRFGGTSGVTSTSLRSETGI